jgi:hypothetical protein
MMKTEKRFAQRMLGAFDLAIDFATLGEYGLEPLPEREPDLEIVPANEPCRERPGRKTGWEALAAVRRGDCRNRQTPRRRQRQLS